MTRFSSILLSGLVLFIFVWSASAAAKMKIVVDQPAYVRLAVGLPDFKLANEQTDTKRQQQRANLMKLLETDLLDSDIFAVTEKSRYVEAATAGIEQSEIDFNDWRIIQIRLLIKGSIHFSGNNLEIQLRAYDVDRGESLLKRAYAATLDKIRPLVHQMVNDLIQEITGEAGIFNTRIAFEIRQKVEKNIAMIDLDGENFQKVTDNRSLNLLPAWAPDGRKLCFTSYRKRNPDLYIVDIGTKKIDIFSNLPGPNIGGAWSPDGRSIAFSSSHDGDSDIYIKPVGGGAMKPVIQDSDLDVAPDWSPDGKQIVYLSDRSGKLQIYEANADGSNEKRLTFTLTYKSCPVWSPKGDKIAFSALENNVFQLYIMDANKGEDGLIEKITDDSYTNESPAWSPDGRYLAFSSNRSGRQAIFTINIYTKTIRKLTKNSNYRESSPAWSPRITYNFQQH
jgi:TolB protein